MSLFSKYRPTEESLREQKLLAPPHMGLIQGGTSRKKRQKEVGEHRFATSILIGEDSGKGEKDVAVERN